MSSHDFDDLFAGPGGWDVGALGLGLHGVGYEMDANACATRRAAGLPTVEGDVRKANPLLNLMTRGLIASPPCQTFSMAGKGAGRASLDRLAQALRTGWWYGQEGDDERTILVLEPYRWIYQRAAAGRPYGWIAFEQVAPVLPIWEVYAEWLRTLGYSVATGVLNAEQFGVPQTRKRAVLVARSTGEARLPEPTHSRYYSRTPEKLDDRVLPWVSMAAALGWSPEFEAVSNYGTGGDPANRGVRTGSEPAAAVTSKVDRVKLRPHGQERNSGPGAAREPRPINAPSFTLRAAGSGMAPGGVRWVEERPATTVNCDPRISRPGRHEPTESGSQQRDAIRVSVAEAAVLQSFPADYPWQGSRTAQFQQIGNAVPPLLARAILAAVTA